MHQVEPSTDLLKKLKGKTAIITGSAGGIGAATATIFNRYSCNVIITDLPSLRHQAEDLIKSLKYSDKAIFVAASVTEWRDLVVAYREGIQKFGRIDIVVANAGIMESRMVLEVEEDASGNPIESREGHRVIDVNLKGTLNSKISISRTLSYMSNIAPKL
jgi:NAD(P)-dependent dehydrogenase (short-subunit alcohol dehydrogenase family)